jgi:predicted aspartyl protease
MIMYRRYMVPMILAALGGCMSDQSSLDCSVGRVAQVPLQPMGQSFLVTVSVAGHDLQMMLDTGATVTMLTDTAVQKWHIPQSGRTFSIGIGISGGSARSNADVTSLTIGGITIPVDHLSVTSWNGNLDGILGLDFLGKYDLDIDGPNRTLGLYHANCLAGPPWASATFVAGTSKAHLLQVQWLQMPIEINGVTSMAVVDTGSSFTTIRAPMMRELGLTEQALADDRAITVHVIAGADAKVYLHKFHTIRIGPVTAQDLGIMVNPTDPPVLSGGYQMPDNFVGQDLLRHRRIWFSLSTGHLYL